MTLLRNHFVTALRLLSLLAAVLVPFGSLAGVSQTLGADLQPDQWFYNPLQWSFSGQAIHAKGGSAETAVFRAALVAKRVSVEAEVEVARVVGKQWKLAAVAIVRDPKNYWHFALVESPDSEQKRHLCELAELRDGVWLAQGNLRQIVRETATEPWQLGQRYRLRLSLTPDGVEGTLADLKGRVIERIGYAFSAEAVTCGRAALRNAGFETTFTEVAATYSEPAQLPASVVVPYQSESFVKEVHGKKTGFFHVEKQGDIWWTIDPLGRGFVPLGVDHATFHGHFCEKLGYAPYGRKNEAKYETSVPWMEETIRRLRSWGFNLLAAGCSPELNYRGLAHTEFVAFGEMVASMGDAMNILPNRGIPGSAFPNVFHPDFETFCRYRAEEVCGPRAGDPWLFGYFLDNELAWWGEGTPDTGLFDAVMRKPATHTAKRALRDLMAQRHADDIARFNQAWDTQLTSFDQLLEQTSLPAALSDAATDDRKAFIALIADRYFGVITRAIRAVDPNHMILGCRFAGGYASDGTWQAAGRYCDLLSFNYYGNVDLDHGLARDDRNPRQGEPLAEVFQELYDLGQRPMMVTEWSFPALDAGLPSIHGAGQRFRTQAERAKATEIYARTMLAMPFLVGYDYFMWVDEPALGISAIFPEDSNYGLVNEDNQPYELLTKAFTRVHQDSGRLRREGLSRAGVATSDPGTYVSPLARLFEKPVVPSSQPNPAFRFERKGDEILASNGPMEVRAKIGDQYLTREIRHQGLVMGRFNGMVQQDVGQNQWIDVDRLEDVKATLGSKAMAIDLVGTYNAPPQSSRRSFELAYRLVMLPNCDWLAIQLLHCRNTSDKPLDLRGIYFRLYSEIGGSAADDQASNVDAVPRLWGDVSGDAWIDGKAGVIWGLATGDSDPVVISFWLDAGQGQHPDAQLELEQSLAPGETFCPVKPVGVICVAGQGDRLQWQDRVRKVLDSLNEP